MSILFQLVQVLIPPVAIYLATQVAKLFPAIDAWSGLAKQLFVVVEAVVFSFIGSKIGVALPSALQGFDVNVFTAILQALAAIGFHQTVGAVKAKFVG